MQNIKQLTIWCKIMEICLTFYVYIQCCTVFFIDGDGGDDDGAHSKMPHANAI